MFSKAFWKAVFERAAKSFAQGSLAAVGVGATTSLFDVDWATVLGIGGTSAVLSVLTSVASSRVGGDGPSLGAEVVK